MKPLVRSLNLKLQGVPPPERRAAMMVLARELEYLRLEKGYDEYWQAYYSEVRSKKRISWEAYNRRNAGFTTATKKDNLQAFLALMDRLRAAEGEDARALLALMEQRPSALTAEERQHMIAEITRMFPEISMLTLRAEYRAKNPPQAAGVQPAAPVELPDTAPAIEKAPAEASAPCLARAEREVEALKSPVPDNSYPTYLSSAAQEVEEMAITCGIEPERARRIAVMVTTKQYIVVKQDVELGRLALKALKSLREETNGRHQS